MYPLCEKIIFLRKKSFRPEIRAGSPELLFCLPKFGKRKCDEDADNGNYAGQDEGQGGVDGLGEEACSD